jgi:hypothetical protein
MCRQVKVCVTCRLVGVALQSRCWASENDLFTASAQGDLVRRQLAQGIHINDMCTCTYEAQRISCQAFIGTMEAGQQINGRIVKY